MIIIVSTPIEEDLIFCYITSVGQYGLPDNVSEVFLNRIIVLPLVEILFSYRYVHCRLS